MSYKTRESCLACDSKIEEILSLGNHNIVGFSKSGNPTIKVPLTLCLCERCSLVQLKHITNPDLLWGGDYWYRSGVNETMRTELRNIVEEAEGLVKLEPLDFVIDIGSNDGTLLKAYKDPRIVRVGFDPARNMVSYFKENLKGLISHLFVDYFHKEPFVKKFNQKAKVITAISMFYDIEDPNTFLKDIKEILHPEGVFIIQQNYLGGMIALNAFDNIVHEHLCYYSLYSLNSLIERHDLEIFNVTTNNLNGGSFRTFIRHKTGLGKNNNVYKMEMLEINQRLNKKTTFGSFARRVVKNKEKLLNFLNKEKERGKKIYVYGSSTRGNTLLQFCGIDYNLITAAAERNPDKWGLKTNGTRIPIVSEEEARKKADYFLVLPWHFFYPEMKEREKEWLKKGGVFILPLPRVKAVSIHGEVEL